ncbi:MAG: CoA pyrophosphatase [Clostridia bacterium]|nr:CoA pyrophosphatase [Clostridia bacterium]
MLNLDTIKNRKARLLDEDKYKKYAVLVPIVNYHGQECLLFEIRSQNLKAQPGEICFPGGRVESIDNNEEEAAVRETCEELGLQKSDLEVIGPLDILITPFQFIITPFVARLFDYQKIKPNNAEVERVFYVPVEFFLNAAPQTYLNQIINIPQPVFPLHLLPNGQTYNWRKGSYPVYLYRYEDYTIWGITARIINNFVEITKA